MLQILSHWMNNDVFGSGARTKCLATTNIEQREKGSEMSDHGALPARNICFQDRLPTGFSFIVDDVDGDVEPEVEDEPEVAATAAAATATVAAAPEAASVGSGGSSGGGSARISRDPSREGSPGAKEETDARIRQMQVEAESRKNEFARLLEEHAQVIQQLKQMEHEPATAPAATGTAPGSGEA